MVEFPRYKYQRINWAKYNYICFLICNLTDLLCPREGITDENSLGFKFAMHKEIFVQAVANMGPLSLPLMVQVYSGYSQPLSVLEITGWLLWLSSLVFEHSADKQKKAFIKNCAEKNISGEVCDVGLWNYCRHPNYFGEWMVWNSLILTSIPALLFILSSQDFHFLVKVKDSPHLHPQTIKACPMLDVAGGRGWKHLLRDVPVSGQLHGGPACRVLQLQVQARIRQVPGQSQHVHTRPSEKDSMNFQIM